jgi:hypothetical protein
MPSELTSIDHGCDQQDAVRVGKQLPSDSSTEPPPSLRNQGPQRIMGALRAAALAHDPLLSALDCGASTTVHRARRGDGRARAPPVGVGSPNPRSIPMTTSPTANITEAEPCPGCDQTDCVRWVISTPDTDSWTCRWCGHEWTITVHVLGGVMTVSRYGSSSPAATPELTRRRSPG